MEGGKTPGPGAWEVEDGMHISYLEAKDTPIASDLQFNFDRSTDGKEEDDDTFRSVTTADGLSQTSVRNMDTKQRLQRLGHMLIEERLSAMKTGTSMIKYSRETLSCREILLRLSPDRKGIFWRQGIRERRVELKNVVGLMFGIKSFNLRRFQLRKPDFITQYPEWSFVTIVLESYSVDLRMAQPDRVISWILGLQHVCPNLYFYWSYGALMSKRGWMKLNAACSKPGSPRYVQNWKGELVSVDSPRGKLLVRVRRIIGQCKISNTETLRRRRSIFKHVYASYGRQAPEGASKWSTNIVADLLNASEDRKRAQTFDTGLRRARTGSFLDLQGSVDDTAFSRQISNGDPNTTGAGASQKPRGTPNQPPRQKQDRANRAQVERGSLGKPRSTAQVGSTGATRSGHQEPGTDGTFTSTADTRETHTAPHTGKVRAATHTDTTHTQSSPSAGAQGTSSNTPSATALRSEDITIGFKDEGGPHDRAMEILMSPRIKSRAKQRGALSVQARAAPLAAGADRVQVKPSEASQPARRVPSIVPVAVIKDGQTMARDGVAIRSEPSPPSADSRPSAIPQRMTAAPTRRSPYSQARQIAGSHAATYQAGLVPDPRLARVFEQEEPGTPDTPVIEVPWSSSTSGRGEQKEASQPAPASAGVPRDISNSQHSEKTSTVVTTAKKYTTHTPTNTSSNSKQRDDAIWSGHSLVSPRLPSSPAVSLSPRRPGTQRIRLRPVWSLRQAAVASATGSKVPTNSQLLPAGSSPSVPAIASPPMVSRVLDSYHGVEEKGSTFPQQVRRR